MCGFPAFVAEGVTGLGCELFFVGYLKIHNDVLKICVLSSTAWQFNKSRPNWIAVALFVFLLPLGNACEDFRKKMFFVGFKGFACKNFEG